MNRKVLSKTAYLMLAATLLVSAFAVPAYADNKKDAYKLTTDIVYTYKMKEMAGLAVVNEKLAELKAVDKDLGETWATLMKYWIYSNTDQEVNEGKLPDNLPKDKSLCIVVLGFQLEADGKMSEELEGRCELALKSAQQYPEAYVAVTGGGTSPGDKTVTEAGQMAEWLEKKGVEKARIIVEDNSVTTEQNAEFLGRIILEDYPEINAVAIITSDYHVPLGSLLFREYFLFANYKNGARKVEVLSNAGFKPKGLREGETIKEQAYDLWSLAEYMKATK